jgi:hypothetical protein
MNLNKNRKLWVNYLLGAFISSLLLWNIYTQVRDQVATHELPVWREFSLNRYLWLGLILMPLNLAIESFKWKMLASSAQPINFFKAFRSFLSGLAFSFLTPNRIGEYPGRIIYLRPKNTIRLVSVSALGIFSQFLTLFLFGIMGLVYYNFHFPGNGPRLVLGLALSALVFIALVFFFFENWAKYLEGLTWFRRYRTYSLLLKRFTLKEQLSVVALSMGRFLIFTTQYLILLKWMSVSFPLSEGYLMAFLFFWGIAVIPSFAFADLGIRGKLSLFLFGNFTTDVVAILAATFALWFINLVVPAIAGSVLIIRMRLWK